MNEKATWTIKSLRELQKESKPYSDSDYRRGFVHGICEAIDALQYCDADSEELCEYTDYLMDHWRYESTDEMILPPGFKSWLLSQQKLEEGLQE